MRQILDDLLRQLTDIRKQVEQLQRLDRPQGAASATTYSGTPTAGRLAQWTGAGTITETSYAGSAVTRYTGVPTAGAVAYWTGNGTVGAATYGTSVVVRYSGAPTAGQIAEWTANGTVQGISTVPRYTGAPTAGQVAEWTGNGTVQGISTVPRYTGAPTAGAISYWTGNGTVAAAGYGTADVVTLAGTQTLTNKTLTTPTIGSFANATHNHTNAAGGGQLTTAALSDISSGTWTVTIASSNADFTTSYTLQNGRYTQVKDIVHFYVQVRVNTISAAGTGDLRISLPFTAATNAEAAVAFQSLDVPNTPFSAVFFVNGGTDYATIRTLRDNNTMETVSITALANSDIIEAQGSYFV